LRVAGHQGTQRNGAKVIRANAGQSTTVSTKRGPDGIANKGLCDVAAHGFTFKEFVNSRIMQYSARPT
jgi:hypothetical protein